jgi:DNA-binding transcriptional LysR family regulator
MTSDAMELDQLRYFVAAAEEASFSRAALRCHITQPALSRQIARLERELRTPLFERVRQRVALNEAGRFFLERARRILCDVETSSQQVREQFAEAPRVLRLGLVAPVLDDLVAPAVRALRQRHPKAKVSLFELRPREQLQRLAERELDAALLGNLDPAERTPFTVKRLARHPLAAVLPQAHPLAARRTLALAELASERFVSLSDAQFPGRRALLQSAARTAGFEPRIERELDSLGLLLAAVADGEGVALLPRHARKLPHEGCAFVALEAPVPQAELFLVTPPGPVSPQLQTLCELLSEKARALAQP